MHRKARRAHKKRHGSLPTGLATAAGVAGEVLLTAGVVVLLYVAYVLWGTGIQTDRAQDELREQIEAWPERPAGSGDTDSDTGGDTDEDLEPPVFEPEDLELGDGYAILRVPRFGADWEWVVVEGVELPDLTRGPGHYPDSAHPGEVGNLSVAGHRAGHGAPFNHMDALKVGDTIEIETYAGVWTYTIDRGPVVIAPTDTWVVDPVPGQGSSVAPSERRITLTTCHPRYGSTQRMYVSGVMTSGKEI